MIQWTIMVSIKISVSCYVQLDGCMDYFYVQSFSHFFNARSKSDLLLVSNFLAIKMFTLSFLASLLPGSLWRYKYIDDDSCSENKSLHTVSKLKDLIG